MPSMTIWNVAVVLPVDGGAQQILDGGGRICGLLVVRRPRQTASGEEGFTGQTSNIIVLKKVASKKASKSRC